MVFADRDDAGRRLATRLGHLRDKPVVVRGLPRGGVPVTFQVAQALGAPLDVIVVRKLGVPFQSELGMGAIGEDGLRVINPRSSTRPGYRTTSSRRSRRESRLRCKPALRATGFGGRASRWMGGSPWWSTTASPLGPRPGPPARSPGRRGGAGSARRARRAAAKIRTHADELVCMETPRGFFAIGQFYAEFPQVSDEEVIARLELPRCP